MNRENLILEISTNLPSWRPSPTDVAPRRAKAVEIAAALKISPRSVERDWGLAKA